jgi:ribosome-interacting GTPase 1
MGFNGLYSVLLILPRERPLVAINASTKDGVNVSYAGAITDIDQSPLNAH